LGRGRDNRGNNKRQGNEGQRKFGHFVLLLFACGGGSKNTEGKYGLPCAGTSELKNFW
jgi:hypothetical protein